jgi:hypothetical protein
MNKTIIGTCSLCSGSVSVPAVWMGVIPPIPTCDSCGAVPKEKYGKTIEMEPQKPNKWVKTCKFGTTITINSDDVYKGIYD